MGDYDQSPLIYSVRVILIPSRKIVKIRLFSIRTFDTYLFIIIFAKVNPFI